MSEELTPLQQSNISNVVSKLYQSEKIVNYDLDLSRWKFKKLYKDTLWVQLLDDPDADTLLRNGVYRPISSVKPPYRIGRVIMAGQDTKEAKEGEYITFSQGLGAPYNRTYEGFKTCLLREEQVMAVVEFDGTPEEIKKNMEDAVFLQ